MSLGWNVVSESADRVLVALEGAVDPSTHLELDGFFAERCAGGRHVVLDLAAVRYVNSTGFGVLVKHAVELERRGGSLSLLGVTPKVRIVVEMLGLESVFACVCDRRPQALAA